MANYQTETPQPKHPINLLGAKNNFKKVIKEYHERIVLVRERLKYRNWRKAFYAEYPQLHTPRHYNFLSNYLAAKNEDPSNEWYLYALERVADAFDLEEKAQIQANNLVKPTQNEAA